MDFAVTSANTSQTVTAGQTANCSLTPPLNPGTPAGTHTVCVTGTAASTSALSHTIQFTLTVD